jgi:hypothetical protein
MNKKTGACEPVKTSTKTRCPKGTRKNKKTGECDKIKSKTSSKSSSRSSSRSSSKSSKSSSRSSSKSSRVSSVKTPVDTTWRITKIEYIHPSVASGDKNGISRDDKGIMNVENIYIENETNIAVIELDNKNVQISVGKKHPKISWEKDSIILTNNIKQKSVFKNFLYAGLNTDTSNIKFVGEENDDDGNYSTKQNVDDIKNGAYGKYIKINVSGNHSLDYLNENDKEQVLQEINKFLPTI